MLLMMYVNFEFLYRCCIYNQFDINIAFAVAGSVDDGSVKGSVIMGPEGELINVGGTIKPHLRDIDLVHDANKVFGKGEKKSFYQERHVPARLTFYQLGNFEFNL